MTVSFLFAGDTIDRAHECEEFARNDPVKITVLNLLVMLVLLNVELAEVVPVLLNCKLKTFETVLDLALIEAIAFASVSVGAELRNVRSQDLHDLI